MGAIKYVRVAIAEAEHLLHEAHSPREVVLGFAEDVLRALVTGTLPDVPEPPRVDAAAPVAVAPSNDPRIDALVAAVAAQQTQFAQLMAAIGPPAREQLPTAVPVTTEAPTVFPVPTTKNVTP